MLLGIMTENNSKNMAYYNKINKKAASISVNMPDCQFQGEVLYEVVEASLFETDVFVKNTRKKRKATLNFTRSE